MANILVPPNLQSDGEAHATGRDLAAALVKDVEKRGPAAIGDLERRDPAGYRLMMAFVHARIAEGIAMRLAAIRGRHAQ